MSQDSECDWPVWHSFDSDSDSDSGPGDQLQTGNMKGGLNEVYCHKYEGCKGKTIDVIL